MGVWARRWKKKILVGVARRLLQMFPDEVLIPPGYHVHKNPRRTAKRKVEGIYKEKECQG